MVAKFQKRIVDKVMADILHDHLEALTEDPHNSIFTTLLLLGVVNKADLKRVIDHARREEQRLRKSADLPERWINVREKLVSDNRQR